MTTRIDPLEAELPYPLRISIEPPVTVLDSPPDNTMFPPGPLPDPTETVMEPPWPFMDDPDSIAMEPLSPSKDKPVPIATSPLTPLLAVPVFSEAEPLTPDTPALAVVIINDPLDVWYP